LPSKNSMKFEKSQLNGQIHFFARGYFLTFRRNPFFHKALQPKVCGNKNNFGWSVPVYPQFSIGPNFFEISALIIFLVKIEAKNNFQLISNPIVNFGFVGIYEQDCLLLIYKLIVIWGIFGKSDDFICNRGFWWYFGLEFYYWDLIGI
jgi:hypothetical protein